MPPVAFPPTAESEAVALSMPSIPTSKTEYLLRIRSVLRARGDIHHMYNVYTNIHLYRFYTHRFTYKLYIQMQHSAVYCTEEALVRREILLLHEDVDEEHAQNLNGERCHQDGHLARRHHAHPAQPLDEQHLRRGSGDLCSAHQEEVGTTETERQRDRETERQREEERQRERRGYLCGDDQEEVGRAPKSSGRLNRRQVGDGLEALHPARTRYVIGMSERV